MSWRFVRLLIAYLPIWVGILLISVGALFNLTLSGDGFMLMLLASGFIQVLGDLMLDRNLDRAKDLALMDVTRVMDRDSTFEYMVQKVMKQGVDRVDAERAVQEMIDKFKLDLSSRGQKKES